MARRLQQTSRFGAWLDVVIDNVGRGMLWNMLYDVCSDSRGMYVCLKHICISLNDFALCACEVGLAGVFSGVVCICVQPQCQRCTMEELVHGESGLGEGSDGKRYGNNLFFYF